MKDIKDICIKEYLIKGLYFYLKNDPKHVFSVCSYFCSCPNVMTPKQPEHNIRIRINANFFMMLLDDFNYGIRMF